MALPVWLTALFTKKTMETAADAGNTIVKGITGGLDVMLLTKEEKVQYTLKGAEIYLKFWDNIAKENTEQSKARRELAKMVFKVFFFFLLSAAVLWKFDQEYSKQMLAYAEYIKWIVSAVTVIYFGPHQIQKIWKKDDDT